MRKPLSVRPSPSLSTPSEHAGAVGGRVVLVVDDVVLVEVVELVEDVVEEVVDDEVEDVLEGVDVEEVLDEVDDELEEVDEELEDDELVGELDAGCQFGSLSMAGTAVGRRVTPLPSGFAVKMSGPLGAPNALEEKTILVPSGDHAGRTELARI
jgi:hypothetical protein